MSAPVVSPTFGPLVSPLNVEQATVKQLRTWLVTYLAEVERQNGLKPRSLPVPPAPDSYYGGIDLESWAEGELPALIVAVQPTGPAERVGVGDYTQWFEIQVGALVTGQHEDAARQLADHYGAAIQGAIVQRGSLGALASKTVLTGSPLVQFPVPEMRRFARSVTTFHACVDEIVTERLGPAAVPRDPYATPLARPTVERVAVTIA